MKLLIHTRMAACIRASHMCDCCITLVRCTSQGSNPDPADRELIYYTAFYIGGIIIEGSVSVCVCVCNLIESLNARALAELQQVGRVIR
jgi:hypothetical protein